MKARSTKNLQKLVSLVLGVAILIGFFKIDVWAADLSALLSMNAGAAEVIDSIDTMTMEEVTELATLDDEEEAEEFKSFIQSIKPSDFARLMKDKDQHESDQ